MVILQGLKCGQHNILYRPTRVVEPFSFTENMIDVWAYDVENADCRVFKVMRIGAVEVLSDDWAFENLHEVRQPDVFRMTGSLKETVVLELNTRAKGLLVEYVRRYDKK